MDLYGILLKTNEIPLSRIPFTEKETISFPKSNKTNEVFFSF